MAGILAGLLTLALGVGAYSIVPTAFLVATRDASTGKVDGTLSKRILFGLLAIDTQPLSDLRSCDIDEHHRPPTKGHSGNTLYRLIILTEKRRVVVLEYENREPVQAAKAQLDAFLQDPTRSKLDVRWKPFGFRRPIICVAWFLLLLGAFLALSNALVMATRLLRT